MKKSIFVILAIISSTTQMAVAKLNKETSFESFDPKTVLDKSVEKTDQLILNTLWKVVAREGKSKNYKDLNRLDGGTVGIAHFAVGGLENLYQRMDTEKYFHKSKAEMISKYTNGCRPKKHRGNDTGWGCYSKTWWREGMQKFLHSPESQKIQNLAYLDKMRPVVALARKKGWKTERQLAIAIGISNSIGSGGFAKLADNHNWHAERILKAYAKNSAHRQRRMVAINKNYPSYQDYLKQGSSIQMAAYNTNEDYSNMTPATSGRVNGR